jgi:hypothetical protein
MRRHIWDFLLGSKIFYEVVRKLHLNRARSRQPVVRLVRPQCSQLFFLYAGMDAYLRGGKVSGMGLFEFLKASGLGDRNLTWVKDPYLDDYRRGIGRDVPDIAALGAWHREHVRSLEHIQDVYTLGYSSGAYGALYFGHLLRARKVWAFSPRTATPKGDAAAKALLLERMAKPNGVTEYEICFAADNKEDRSFGNVLAGCPGVTLRAYEGCGATHFLLNYLVEKDQLRSLFPAFAGSVPVNSG